MAPDTKKQKEEMREILESNNGFVYPEQWIQYGIKHHFKKIPSEKILACPDCSGRRFSPIGQFIYYSTMVKLQTCTHCGLVFTDTRIDPKVIQAHFEFTYKEESYFLCQRDRIYHQISKIVDSMAPKEGRVLDIGGAKGHLLVMIKRRRPDLTLVLNDVSKDACLHGEAEYGFETVLGSINELEGLLYRFDVIILSDVIYYEPELRRLWTLLPRLISKNGTVIIRVPNKLRLIRFWAFMIQSMCRPEHNETRDKIKFFNPEHLYVLSRRYLSMRLKSIGFDNVMAIASELKVNTAHRLSCVVAYHLCRLVSMVTLGKIILSPSFMIIASVQRRK